MLRSRFRLQPRAPSQLSQLPLQRSSPENSRYRWMTPDWECCQHPRKRHSRCRKTRQKRVRPEVRCSSQDAPSSCASSYAPTLLRHSHLTHLLPTLFPPELVLVSLRSHSIEWLLHFKTVDSFASLRYYHHAFR